MNPIDLTPNPDDIVQAEQPEYPLQCVPVSVDGPVQTRELPAVRAGYSTFPSVADDVAVRLLTFEPRRKSATLVGVEGMWLSGSQAGATSVTSAVFVPANTPFEITHLGEVWARTDDGHTGNISVMTTWWSE